MRPARERDSVTGPVKTVTATIELWTPDQARLALANQQNFTNRHLKGRVDSFAADMKAGRWRLNGESVVFAGKRLIDGQHRLHAIVQADVPVPMVTVRGVDPSVMATIDTGTSRTPGDALHVVLGDIVTKNHNQVAASAKLAWQYLTHHVIRHGGGGASPLRWELMEFIQANPSITASVELSVAKPLTAIRHTSLVGAMHFLCGRNHPTERDAFFLDLGEGTNLSRTRPVRLLRERLLSEQISRRKFRIDVLAAMFVKAFNAEVLGRAMLSLRHREDETFPLISGDERGVK